MNSKKLRIRWRWGNAYSIKDDVVTGTANLFGSADGMMIELKSIEPAQPPQNRGEGVDVDELIQHLGREIARQKNYGKFFIMYKWKIVYSTDKELPVGDLKPAPIKPINIGSLGFRFWRWNRW